MNKTIVSIVVALLVGLGLGWYIPHGAISEQAFGGSGGVQLDRHFTYGLYAGSSDQLSIASTGALTTSAAISASANRGTVTTSAAGTGTTTVFSGAICTAADTTATGTISTFASTSGTTLTVKGVPSHVFQYTCF